LSMAQRFAPLKRGSLAGTDSRKNLSG